LKNRANNSETDRFQVEFRAKKAEIVLRLLKAIESPLSQLVRGSCGNGTTITGQYIGALKACGLWPLADVFQQQSISVIFLRMVSLQEPKVSRCTYIGCTECRNLNFREALRNGQEGISKAKMGLCLDCVQTEGKSLQEKKCRFSHGVE
jgi:hypothetical protein